jgi:hypothetical protein
MAAMAALALMAAPNDQGSAQSPEPAAEADPAEEEAAAVATEDGAPEEQVEEEAAPEAAPEKVGKPAGGAKKPKATAAASQDVLLIWVQPGHDRYFIGQPVPVPASDAEFLRAAGRAREATDAEIKAWKDASKAAD